MRKLFSIIGIGMVMMFTIFAGNDIAHAEDTECRGAYGEVTLTGNLIVLDDATCTLNGTNVQGNITVKSRGTLDATNIQVTGGIKGESPRSIRISRSSVGNSVQVRKGGPLPGSPEVVAVDIEFTNVTGDIQLEENVGFVSLVENQISGSVQANKNTGGVKITSNIIGNGLQCQDNNPPPTGSGNVAKQKQAQCQNL